MEAILTGRPQGSLLAYDHENAHGELGWDGDPSRMHKARWDAASAGRPQGCAPTMDEPDKPIRDIVGAMACPRPGWGGRPFGIMMRLSSHEKPVEQLM